MRIVLAIFLGISFAGIALFGFSVASGGAHAAGCVADAFAALQGGACPTTENPLMLISSHVNSLHGFLGNGVAAISAFLALLTLAFPLIFAVPPARSAAHAVFLGNAVSAPRARAKRIRWTALHETSPTPTP